MLKGKTYFHLNCQEMFYTKSSFQERDQFPNLP